ncbi:MAG TPA: YceI family protein [Vicinamibacterales bacterium]
MRTRLVAVAAVAVALAQLPSPALEARTSSPVYTIDPARSVAQFTITKLGYSDVVGTFGESAGEIRWHPAEPEASSIRWRVAVASVRTDAANRDRALQGPDYFDAARHPELVFESTRVRAAGPGRLEVQGRLTMRGVTREQTAIVRYSGTASAPVFETDFDVDRYAFGIRGGGVMGRLIGRTARIHLRAVTRELT